MVTRKKENPPPRCKSESKSNDINCVAGGGELMKFEDYIQSCSHWVRLYEKVWGYKCWGGDWVEKGLSEYRLSFCRKAEQIDREWSSFEDFDEIGSSQMVEMYQMVMMAGVGMRMAARMLKAKEEDASAIEEWTGIPSKAISKRIDELRKRVRVSHSVFTALKAREFDYEDPQLGYEFTKNEILSQIFITLDERCDEDPFHALRDSLEGKLNILPRAVSRIKLHLSLPEEDPNRIEAEEKGAEDPLTQLEYEWDRDKEIDKWAAGSEKKKRFIQGLIAGHTLKEIAKELGINKNTATNWRKNIDAIKETLRS